MLLQSVVGGGDAVHITLARINAFRAHVRSEHQVPHGTRERSYSSWIWELLCVELREMPEKKQK
jgi:hypothetical protein